MPDPDPTTPPATPEATPDAPKVAPPAPGSAAKPRRRWRLAAIFFLLALLALVGTVSFMTRSSRLVVVIEKVLEDTIGCEANVGRVDLRWNGQLTVDGIELTVPGMTGEAAKLLHSDRVVVRLRFLPLLIGRTQAASVSLSHPTLYLTEDLDADFFNYENLIATPPGEDDHGGLPKVLPELFLNAGQIQFGQVHQGEYTSVQGIRFDGMLMAEVGRVGGYTFIFNQQDVDDNTADGNLGPTIHGRIDLSVPEVEVQVDRFKFAGPHRYLLPQEMRAWWVSLSPQGELPKVIFHAGLDDAGETSLSAELRLNGIGLSLPIEEGEPLRMTDVSGRVLLVEGAVELKQIAGQIEGIAFTGEGRIGGFESQSPLSISLSTEPFDVPAEGGIWPKLPPQIRRYQERFSPHGRYQSRVVIDRQVAAGPLIFSGHLDLLDTRFKYNKFPYPAEQLTGRVTFDNERVELHDLKALGPSGGHAIVSGTIIPPGGDSEVDIKIAGEGFAVDDFLLDAMKPKHRKVMDLFFNPQGYEYLLEQGVVRKPDNAFDEPSEVSDAPVFEPGGTASMIVRIQRPAGPGESYSVTTDLDVSGLRSVFGFWHYPLYAERGRVVISPQDVQVHKVHLRAIGGGGGIVDGRLILPSEGQPMRPSLQMTSVRLPINKALVSSIPKPKDQWVRSLNLRGTLIGTGEVYADADGEVAFTVDTVLRDGTASPNGGAYPLVDVQGSVTVERKRMQLENLSCRNDEGTITVNGLADFSEGGLGVDLVFLGDDLRIESGLIDLLPGGHEGRPLVTSIFDDYRPDGQLDAKLHYFGGDEGSDHFTLDVQPQTLSLDLNGQRIELEDMTGRAELTQKQAVLHDLAGRFAAGTFRIDGEVRLFEDPGVNLAFDVHAGRIDATARAVLPKAVLSFIDRFEVQGPYTVNDAHLLSWPDVQEGPTMIFEGKVHLRDARAQIGVPVTELDAEMDMHIATFAEQPWPHTDIRVNADSLRVSDRRIERLTMNAATGRQPWLIEFSDVKGAVYGGTLVGRGQLRMGKEAAFGFDLTLQEVELEPFLNPLVMTESESAEPLDPANLTTRNMASGLLSAGLTIRIPSDDPSQRQGRGVVTVRDAKLYDKPLTLALLQAASLTLPNESSFDRASARYLIYGDTVQFDDIRFEAPAFVLAGSGTMDFPTTELYLRMVTHNPAAPNLGAVSALVQSFKDELLGIEVRGTLAKPQARVVSLGGIFRSWDRVFGNSSAKMHRLQPAEPIKSP